MPYEIVDVPPARALVASTTCSHEQLGPVISEMFGGLIQRFADAELIEAPRIYYRQWREHDCEVEAAFIIDPDSLPGAQLTEYPGCRAVMAVHQGAYEGLSDAWMRLWAEVHRDGLETIALPPWDSYEVGAFQESDSSQWLTEIYIPIAR